MDQVNNTLAGQPKSLARHLYWQGYKPQQIGEWLGIHKSRVYAWKKAGRWDENKPLDRVDAALEARYIQLLFKDGKSNLDFKEIDALGRQMKEMARVRKYASSGAESDLNQRVARGIRKREKTKAAKKEQQNAVGQQEVEQLSIAFEQELFDYQREWLAVQDKHRIRNILKSRQIGATWYFAREAIVDALRTGRNKVFVSASKAQADIFRTYIVQFVQAVADVELKGNPIQIPNGATLYFLGTNAKTAQGYHGDVYVDEYFWIGGFSQFRRVVSGMAMHKKWHQTYISTPSTIGHEAYPFWTGEQFNQGRPRDERSVIDVSHDALVDGAVCADGQWRQIVTVHDAIDKGCNLFDLEQLRREYSPEEFANLLECKFADDQQSAFPLLVMQACMVDSWEAWDDVRPFAEDPVAQAPVWIGYDPAGESVDGDGAGLVIDLPPDTPKGKHRLLERHELRGSDYQAQAEFIKKCCERYNVTHIGIDCTGMGEGVSQIVEQFFPSLVRYKYTPQLKTQMVLQAQQLIRRKRLEFDAGWTDLAKAFMAIKKEQTSSGRHTTYQARRSSDTGHAELAWATMHALHAEPLAGSNEEQSASILEFSQ